MAKTRKTNKHAACCNSFGGQKKFNLMIENLKVKLAEAIERGVLRPRLIADIRRILDNPAGIKEVQTIYDICFAFEINLDEVYPDQHATAKQA